MKHSTRAALLCGTILAWQAQASAFTFDTAIGSIVVQHQSSGTPLTWAQSSVPVALELGEYNDAACDALLEWSAVVPLLVPQDGAANVVRWAKPEEVGNWVAYTQKSYEQRALVHGPFAGKLGVVITQATVMLNPRLCWAVYDGPLQTGACHGGQDIIFDVRRVVLHELGHVLGLEHPDEGGQSVSAIMNHAVSAVAMLQSDDMAGIQELYPPRQAVAHAQAVSAAAAASPSGGHGGGCSMREDGEPDVAFWLFVAALVVHWLAARVLARKTLRRRVK
jgi:hypothetical protein